MDRTSPLQKPPRDPDVTERMILKSRHIHQKQTSRRWIGGVIVLLVVVAAIAFVLYRFYFSSSIRVTAP